MPRKNWKLLLSPWAMGLVLAAVQFDCGKQLGISC
jgi:hypothetical protein